MKIIRSQRKKALLIGINYKLANGRKVEPTATNVDNAAVKSEGIDGENTKPRDTNPDNVKPEDAATVEPEEKLHVLSFAQRDAENFRELLICESISSRLLRGEVRTNLYRSQVWLSRVRHGLDDGELEQSGSPSNKEEHCKSNFHSKSVHGDRSNVAGNAADTDRATR